MRWLNSNGGPLLFLGEGLLRYWEGGDPPSGDRVVRASHPLGGPVAPATDYDRACEVVGYLGAIEVGPGHAIVLGDEPFPTGWVSFPDARGGMLVCWGNAEDEDSVLRHLSTLGEATFPSGGLRYQVDEPVQVLFDSAERGEDDGPGRLRVELVPGSYQVATCDYRPDESTWLLLHRFLPGSADRSQRTG